MHIFMNIVRMVGRTCTENNIIEFGVILYGGYQKSNFAKKKPKMQFCWVHCAYSMCKVWWKNILRIRRKIGFYVTPQKWWKLFFPKLFSPIQNTLLQIFRDILKIALDKSLLENFQKYVNLYGGYQKTDFPGYDLYTIF